MQCSAGKAAMELSASSQREFFRAVDAGDDYASKAGKNETTNSDHFTCLFQLLSGVH